MLAVASNSQVPRSNDRALQPGMTTFQPGLTLSAPPRLCASLAKLGTETREARVDISAGANVGFRARAAQALTKDSTAFLNSSLCRFPLLDSGGHGSIPIL